MNWAINGTFSPDGRFVYVCDPKTAGRSSAAKEGVKGAVTAFLVTENRKLKWIETFAGQDNCFDGARSIVFHPSRKLAFVASTTANALVVLDWNDKTGQMTIRQIIYDEEGKACALAGAMDLDWSPDGRFAYVSSGRFKGDDAVSVFELTAEDKLVWVEEFVSESSELRGFTGGNVICVSPDGRNVYAAGSTSHSLACFERDGETGKLKYLETLPDDATLNHLSGAAGVAVSIELSGDEVTDDVLDHVARFSRLEKLHLNGTAITDTGLVRVARLEKLESLELTETLVRDVRPVLAMTNLRRLILAKTGVDDTCLSQLVELQDLETLDLSFTRVTEAGLRDLRHFRHLQQLYLIGIEVTDEGLEDLASNDELTGLWLWNAPIRGEGISHLQAAKGLSTLDLSDTLVDDAGLEHIGRCTALQNLSLEGTLVTDAGLVHLMSLKNLEVLNLVGTSITGPGLAHLQGMTRLAQLNLYNAPVTDQGLKYLFEMKALRELHLWNSRATPAGVRELTLKLPNLKITE